MIQYVITFEFDEEFKDMCTKSSLPTRKNILSVLGANFPDVENVKLAMFYDDCPKYDDNLKETRYN